MTLPVVPLPTGTATLGGTTVAIKSLSRAAVLSLSSLDDDAGAAEILMLTQGTGVTEDEARAWRESTDADTVGLLLEEIAVISGIRKPRKPDEPVGEA